ncbi:MAG: hypothetical protein JJ873_16090 [Maricaulis sp.]|uniref:hypothetical protein n=1 Tax=Maricaulis sp. TaxID=1486257 RepID=UPI001B15F6B5|nr:hypothetical protein [Maricaulis sp.]MBO6697051.1 hypothetical protein [Henriciella sp.]MBO6878903.1 hypothetical protein [Maricaulis sp.]
MIRDMLMEHGFFEASYQDSGRSGVRGQVGVDLIQMFDSLLSAISRAVQGAEDCGETSSRNDFNAEDINQTIVATNPDTGELGYYHFMDDGSIWVDSDGDGRPGTHFILRGDQAWADTDLDGDFETMVPLPAPGN